MAKLGVYKSLLTSSDAEPIVAGLQIMQHVGGLVNHDVAVRILRLVSGPPHVGIVSGESITPHLDIVRLEPMVSE